MWVFVLGGRVPIRAKYALDSEHGTCYALLESPIACFYPLFSFEYFSAHATVARSTERRWRGSRSRMMVRVDLLLVHVGICSQKSALKHRWLPATHGAGGPAMQSSTWL